MFEKIIVIKYLSSDLNYEHQAQCIFNEEKMYYRDLIFLSKIALQGVKTLVDAQYISEQVSFVEIKNEKIVIEICFL